MHTMASKNSAANGSERASAWIGKTPSSTPASRIRWMFSEALNHRSVAHTCTPNSRRRRIDDDARPQPRSSTRMPGRKSSTSVSHSVSHSELAPPLTLAITHSGLYREERGNRAETSWLSEVMGSSLAERSATTVPAARGHRTFNELGESLHPRGRGIKQLGRRVAVPFGGRPCHPERSEGSLFPPQGCFASL